MNMDVNEKINNSNYYDNCKRKNCMCSQNCPSKSEGYFCHQIWYESIGNTITVCLN